MKKEILFFTLFIILFFIILVLINFGPKIRFNDNVKVMMSEEYKGPKVTADFFGKDITKKIKTNTTNLNMKKAGFYKINYSVKYKNMETDEIMHVEVVDNIKPELTLKGPEILYLSEKEKYKEPGYKAFDNNDGNITSKVKVEGKVLPKIGTYKLKYTIKDNYLNTIIKTRTVKVVKDKNIKTIYLTFDDGPSSITPKVLDILKEEKVKATFFVIQKEKGFEKYIKRANDEGHTVALHSASHEYKEIYSSMDSYFNDLNLINNYVKRIINHEPKIIRFPGGSSNTVSSFNPGIMTKITDEVTKRGYAYFDWNIDSGDTGRIGSQKIVENVINSLGNYHTYVVLMHDYGLNQQTVDALKQIITYGKENGYQFDRITQDTPLIQHQVNN